MRTKRVVLLLSFCFLGACRTSPAASPASTTPPPSLPAPPPAATAERSPLDALAEEARRSDLAVLVTRDGKVLFEHGAGSVGGHPIYVLGPVLTFLAARSNLPEADANARDEWILGREPLYLTDYSGRSIAPELFERGVYGPLGIGPSDHAGTFLSLAAAERVARLFADGGVFEGKRILPERFVARVTSAERKLAWEPIGEGELAVITRPIFDAWRGVPSIHRSTLTTLESLVDVPIPVDDFARALEEKLGRNADLFMNELMKAQRKPFERRWRSIIGFGVFGPDAVVVLSRTKLIAVYAPAKTGYAARNLVPLLRALE